MLIFTKVNIAPFILSLELASLTAGLLLLLSIPLIFCIYRAPKWVEIPLKAMVSLPLVLPPTVLGYYLLLAFRPESTFSQVLGGSLAFRFEGLLIGSMLFSLPFMINPILSALEAIPTSYVEVSASLGLSEWRTYWHILLPMVKPSILTATIMAFAHTIGEFGVVLMIGGNIPGVTRVASIEIYHQVEGGNYAEADGYAAILLVFSLAILIVLYGMRGKKPL